MTDGSAKVFDLRPSGNSYLGWPEIQNTAIFPAFRHLGEHLRAMNIETWILENNEFHKRPFLILFWNGRGTLDGIRVGLHFTYGGERMRFDLSAVKDADGYRHQTTFTTEFFASDERDLPAKVLMRASCGLGRALQIEAGSVPRAEWIKTKFNPTHH